MNERINLLRKRLQEEKRELFLVTSPENVFYLSGFHGSAGAILLSAQSARLYVDFRYTLQAQKEAPGFEILPYTDLHKTLEKFTGSISFEEKSMTVKELRGFLESVSAQWVDGSDLLEDLRVIKSPKELLTMRQAAKISDMAFSELLNELRPGMTEIEAASRLEFLMRAKGAQKTSFDTIAVSGSRSALPHGKPTDKVIQTGEFVTFDFGCVFEGYCSDMTRTVAVGEISDEMRKVYETVKTAQQTACDRLMPNMTGREADQTARNIIAQKGYGEYFGHGTGHGVGIMIHERPTLSPRGEEVLRPGMVVTVEPGIYLPDKFGVRIEDMGLIHESGFEAFSDFTKELIMI